MPHADAQPITDNKNVICQDHWVSFFVTLITIIGILCYIWHHYKKFTLCKGYRYEGACKTYIFLSHTSFFVKIKRKDTGGHLHLYTSSKPLYCEQFSLHKKYLWDTIHIDWKDAILKVSNKTISLPTVITVPLMDKIRTKLIFHKENIAAHFMIQKGKTWFSLQPKQQAIESSLDQMSTIT